MPKEVVFGNECRNKIANGVNILANAVKATLGPRGRNVLIERAKGDPFITKDGVTVARYIDLEDPLENMGARLIRSVASNANSESGDGTTTATVLAQAIYINGLKHVSDGNNPIFLKRGIDLAASIAIDALSKKVIKISDEKALSHVATISANNDKVLGGMIAETIAAVGNDGVVFVEEALGSITKVIYEDGLELSRGFVNEIFVNTSKGLSQLEEPYIILCDDDVKSLKYFTNIINNKIVNTDKPFVMIVKNMTSEALLPLAQAHAQNNLKCCVVRAPGTGDERKALMDDIAILTGGKVFTSVAMLENAELSDLGRCRLFVAGVNSSKMIDGAASDVAKNNAIELLKEQLNDDKLFEEQKEIIGHRISRLSGGVAIFKVGGKSEAEMRELKDRVEDAINAVKSALSEGIVPGGGCAWIHTLGSLDQIDKTNLTKEEILGIDIVRTALQEPFKQIIKNAGFSTDSDIDDLLQKVRVMNDLAGYDAFTMSLSENMIEQGIIDPFKVVRTSLQHAISVASTLLTTEVSIYQK